MFKIKTLPMVVGNDNNEETGKNWVQFINE